MNIYTENKNDIIHETSVDFVLRPCTKEIHIVQYDKSLPIIKVELFKNGERYVLSENAAVNIRVGKLDHTFVYESILGTNDERNIVYFEISEQMALIPGKIWPVLEVIENEKIACSSPLCFIIEKNPIQEGQIESHDDFPIIYELQGTVANHELRISNIEQQVSYIDDALNTKLDKVTGTTQYTQVYAKSGNTGAQAMIGVSSSSVPSNIVRRNADSLFDVSEPVYDSNPTTKQYVDYTISIKIKDLNICNGAGKYSLVSKTDYAVHANKAYQHGTIALGALSEAGMTQTEFNEHFKYNRDGSIRNPIVDDSNQPYAKSESYACAIGENAKAKDRASFASGMGATAWGAGSQAFGDHTQALANFATAIGNHTIAGKTRYNGEGAFAQGYYTEAPINYSSAFGAYTKTLKLNSTVVGQYNKLTNDSGENYITKGIFSVGTGDSSARRTTFTVTVNNEVVVSDSEAKFINKGTTELKGQSTYALGSNPTLDTELINKIYVNTRFVNITDKQTITGEKTFNSINISDNNNHSFKLIPEVIDANNDIDELMIKSNRNTHTLLSVIAPDTNPKEATFSLKVPSTTENGATYFMDISSMNYENPDEGPEESIYIQSRNASIKPTFNIGFTDESQTRHKKFIINHDALPIMMVSDGIWIKNTNDKSLYSWGDRTELSLTEIQSIKSISWLTTRVSNIENNMVYKGDSTEPLRLYTFGQFEGSTYNSLKVATNYTDWSSYALIPNINCLNESVVRLEPNGINQNYDSGVYQIYGHMPLSAAENKRSSLEYCFNISNTPNSAYIPQYNVDGRLKSNDPVDNDDVVNKRTLNSSFRSITPATRCKITYDSKGLVVTGVGLSDYDIPYLNTSKINSGTFPDARIASASTWNAKTKVTLNGSTVADASIYAPITSGTSGQYLKSNGSGTPPTWVSAGTIVGGYTFELTLQEGGTVSTSVHLIIVAYKSDGTYSTHDLYSNSNTSITLFDIIAVKVQCVSMGSENHVFNTIGKGNVFGTIINPGITKIWDFASISGLGNGDQADLLLLGDCSCTIIYESN